jgi:hypothetical protein
VKGIALGIEARVPSITIEPGLRTSTGKRFGLLPGPITVTFAERIGITLPLKVRLVLPGEELLDLG